jgi:multiple sugar transport system substrate-binding protein
MDFYTFCLALGETPFATRERVISTDTGHLALDRLRELISLCDPGCWTRNPIASHNLLSSAANTRIAYSAFAYGYSNYARSGYADHVLTFGDLPHFNNQPLHTTLGGTGLALSALRPNREAALAYAQFAASSNVQRTLVTQAGGQPGHRTAWLAPENNRTSGNYFANTLPTLDRAYVRPRYCGYMEFQERGSALIHAALRNQLSDTTALADLDTLYRETLTHAPSLS